MSGSSTSSSTHVQLDYSAISRRGVIAAVLAPAGCVITGLTDMALREFITDDGSALHAPRPRRVQDVGRTTTNLTDLR